MANCDNERSWTARAGSWALLGWLRWPHRWLQNLVRLRDKRVMPFAAVFVVVCFVGLARAELELVVATTYGYGPSTLLNNIVFYLQAAYLYGLMASVTTGRAVERVMGVVIVGVFLGVFPPILDVFLGGVGSGYYRYISGGFSAWKWSMVNPAHCSFGETIVLWMLIAVLGCYVAEVTRSWLRSAAALAAGYGGVMIISMGPSSLAELMVPDNWPAARDFKVALISIFQLALAQGAYFAARPSLARRLWGRLVHALPFVALVFLGCAVSHWFSPSRLETSERLWVASFLAICIFELCIVALVQNDAFDAKEDRARPDQGPTKEDAYFFTATGTLWVLALLFFAAPAGMPLALFLVVSIVYSFDFYRGKRFFPANYKIEGIWAWSAFMTGANAQRSLHGTPSAEFLLASFLVFGGWSVFNVFKDYKDIRQDYHAGNQTLYVLAKRRGIRLKKLHNGLCMAFAVGLVVPPAALMLCGVNWVAVALVAVATVPPTGYVLTRGPHSSTVRAFLWAVTAYIAALTAAIEVHPWI